MLDKKPCDQFRQGGLCVFLFLLLGASHVVVGFWFGRGWTLVTAVLAEIAWLILHPWRRGNLSPPVRRTLCWGGTSALGVFIIIALLLYWRLPEV